MKRPILSPPDTFSSSPLLALLPVVGVVGELEKLTSSLFARYERVRALKKSLDEDALRESQRRIVAEEAMLRHILDWLSVTLEDGAV